MEEPETQHPAQGPLPGPRRNDSKLIFGLACLFLLTPLLGTVLGSQTLFFRDVSNLHLPSKWSQSAQWQQGHLPLLDLQRAGGQPSLGNPNLLPLYPSNLLYLVAPTVWAFNAHFWLHLLLMPFTIAWLARELGLPPPVDRWAGLLFAASGFAFSQLNFYNLIAVTAVFPAFLAATLAARRQRGFSPFFTVALSWGLLLLAGDPQLAALALALAALLSIWPPAVSDSRETSRLQVVWWGCWLTALALGILLGLPQHIEFLRVLSGAYRTQIGYSSASALVASWDPRQALEWILPFAYGRPDQTFWGLRYSGDQQPFFFSLYAGTTAMAALLVSGVPRSRLQRACWIAIGVGIFAALGQHNPLVRAGVELAGSSLLRLPIKAWMLVALATSLLAAATLARVADAEAPLARARFGAALGGLLALQLLLMVIFSGSWGMQWLSERVPPSFGPDRIEEIASGMEQALRWSLAGGVGVLLLFWLARRGSPQRPLGRRAMESILLIHVLCQVLILRPLVPTDQVALSAERPPVLDALTGFDDNPPTSVMLGDQYLAFGLGSDASIRYPDSKALWIQRRGLALLFPAVGSRWGVHYETNVSPDGLDHYASHLGLQALKGAANDHERLRLLGAWGVRYLIVGRRLDSSAPDHWYRQRAAFESFGGQVGTFELTRTAPPLLLSSDLRPAVTLGQARTAILDDTFDPRHTLAIGGLEAAQQGSVGSVLQQKFSADSPRIEVEVEHHEAGFLLLPRAFQPQYRAWVDGQEVATTSANLNRLAVPVPAGRHQIVIDAQRVAPIAVTLLSLGAWLLCLGGIAAGRLRAGHRRRHESR